MYLLTYYSTIVLFLGIDILCVTYYCKPINFRAPLIFAIFAGR